MNNYSIVRVGNEYVVRADDKSVLKTASRRRAARTVTDASELLERQPAPHAPPEIPAGPSIACDLPGSHLTPEVIADPAGGIADPAKVS
jgi:hypothetical protein